MAQYAPPDPQRASHYVAAQAQVNKYLNPDGSIDTTAAGGSSGGGGGAAVASTMNTGQVSLGTTATQIVAANSGRLRITIFNVAGNAFFIGNSGVTAANGSGVPAIAGYPVVIKATAAIFGIVGTGANNVSYIEEVA